MWRADGDGYKGRFPGGGGRQSRLPASPSSLPVARSAYFFVVLQRLQRCNGGSGATSGGCWRGTLTVGRAFPGRNTDRPTRQRGTSERRYSGKAGGSAAGLGEQSAGRANGRTSDSTWTVTGFEGFHARPAIDLVSTAAATATATAVDRVDLSESRGSPIRGSALAYRHSTSVFRVLVDACRNSVCVIFVAFRNGVAVGV